MTSDQVVLDQRGALAVSEPLANLRAQPLGELGVMRVEGLLKAARRDQAALEGQGQLGDPRVRRLGTRACVEGEADGSAAHVEEQRNEELSKRAPAVHAPHGCTPAARSACGQLPHPRQLCVAGPGRAFRAEMLLSLVRFADKAGVDLYGAALAEPALNAERFPAEQVRGSARKYSK